MGKITAKVFFFLLLLLLFVGVVLVLSQLKKSSKQEKSQILTVAPTISQDKNVDIKASFAIFTNGTFRIFTNPRYHNLSPDVFLQADNPNIVHVKKEGLIWDDFFKTLPMQLTEDCLITGTGQTFCTQDGSSLKFYLNGARIDNLLQQEIKDGDEALISYGSDEAIIQQQIEALNKIDEK